MTTAHEEIERKYEGSLSQPLAPDGLPRVTRVVPGGTEHLDAVYYDTVDLRLLRGGITLRRRSGGQDAGWHLKTPGAEDSRTETRLPLDVQDGRRPPEEMVRLTRGAARGRPLSPVAHLRTTRERTVLEGGDGRVLAELVRDEVIAHPLAPGTFEADGAAADAWVETEVELVDGPRELLDAVEHRLGELGLRRAADRSKLQRALGGRLDGLPAEAAAEPAEGSVGAALTAYLREQAAALRELDPAVRLDRPDSVHRMRVHIRRLRSALAAHRRVVDRSVTEPLSRELRWFGRVLGRARDAEVLGERLGTQAAALPAAGRPDEVGARIAEWFGGHYAYAHRAAVHVMENERYFALLDAVEELAARPPLTERAGRGKPEARKALKKQQRRAVRQLGAALDLPPGTDRDAALHRARKAAKRARYAAEALRPAKPGRAERLRKRMKRIQQPLGSHQDGVVAEPALLELAAEARRHGEDTFGHGLLYGRQRAHEEEQVEDAAKAWRKAKG
ncbi:CYTH and CHAD domain-containing protein [Kitasatospora camelliae]|uniref:CYTH and CHAD domain-containing protein n=1 Tax=Kitasatospora camelliae TaxID=3156397 RepID=A0AAU8JR08_9ACTN